MINEALVEICVVAYSVTRQEARMYSKYLAQTEPDVYNMKLFDAAAATSSAPLYWELKETTLPDNSTEVLIDGGVVENNPAIYAQSLALIERMKSVKGEKPSRPVRLISLGTGGSTVVNKYSGSKHVNDQSLPLSYWWK